MTYQEEVNIWMCFWSPIVILFVILWCFAHFYCKHEWIYKETKDVYRKDYKECKKCGKIIF